MIVENTSREKVDREKKADFECKYMPFFYLPLNIY